MQRILKTGHTEFAYREEITGSKRIFDTHCHLSFELIAVYEGAVHIIVEGKRVELQPYHMAIIPPHLYHSVFSVKSGNYRRVTILFDRDLIPEQIREEVVTAIGEEPFYVHPFLKQVLDPLAEVLQMPEPDRYGPLVESILIQILYHRIMYSSVGSLGESDPMIHQISEYIDRHIHDRITLDDIARHLYLSKSTLCHVFRRKMNISVKQYILQKKIVYAADLIRNKMPAKEAARSIGYDNYANFYKMYKKFFSETPARRDK